jgi:CubicO group peptidase (beta-lactamase class C family)
MVALGLTISHLQAQSFEKARLDSLMIGLESNNKAMGSLLIVKNGQPEYDKSIGYGLINKRKSEKLDKRSKYRIGSISKMFTAVITFQLIEEGKLQLSTPLALYFPQLSNAQTITIEQMLGHKSGLYDYVKDWDSWRFTPKTDNDIVAMVAAQKPVFEPGTKTAYSNTNYLLLGYIIEKICGKPYAQVLQERITSKIGLKNTYYGGNINATKKEAFSYAYEEGAWKQQTETHITAAGGAGGIVSTTTDLTKFVQALFAEKLINQNSLNQMLAVKEGIGLGIEQLPFYDKTLYGHSGQIDYFQSWLLYLPKDSVAIAYLSNGYGGVPVNDVLNGVLHLYYGKPYTIANYTSVAVAPAELDTYTGTYTCSQPAMQLKVIQQKGKLYAQATGQSPFPLDAVTTHTFKFDAAGIVIEFLENKQGLNLKQGGGTYVFTKDLTVQQPAK